MTNQDEIKAAIDAESAHDLADALAACGVSTTRHGRRGSDDESCEVDGYGKIWFHDLAENPGWVVRDDCDHPVDDRDPLAELAAIVAMTERIRADKCKVETPHRRASSACSATDETYTEPKMAENEGLNYICKEIKKRRIELGLTQVELAEKTGFHQAHISKYERGTVPMVAALTKLSEVLGPFEISADRHSQDN